MGEFYVDMLSYPASTVELQHMMLWLLAALTIDREIIAMIPQTT